MERSRAEEETLREYLLMLTDIAGRWDAMPPAEQQRIMDAHRRVRRRAPRGEAARDVYRLRPPDQARTVRFVAPERRDVTDGPFAETKEVMGGFYVIEAASMEEAIALGEAHSARPRLDRGPADLGDELNRGGPHAVPADDLRRPRRVGKVAVRNGSGSCRRTAVCRPSSRRKENRSVAIGCVTEAATVRVQNGQHVVSDGPFTETKEVMGGYYLIDCASQAEAIEWAKRLPLAEGRSSVEVRAIWDE